MADKTLTPPQNLEAERAVLGGMLMDPVVIDDIIEFLRDSHFYLRRHALIFAAIIKLTIENKPVNTITGICGAFAST